MRIETEIMSCFEALLSGLKSKPEGQGRLLDRTLTVFGSNLGNGAAHDPRNNPIILAGGGHAHGRYVRHDAQNNTPLSNLYLRMLQEMGIQTDRFATSSGALEI